MKKKRTCLIKLHLFAKEKKHHYLTCKINYTMEIAKLLTAVLLKSVFTYHVK